MYCGKKVDDCRQRPRIDLLSERELPYSHTTTVLAEGDSRGRASKKERENKVKPSSPIP